MKIVVKEITLKMENLEMYAMTCWDSEILCFLTKRLLLKGPVQLNIHTIQIGMYILQDTKFILPVSILCSK